MQKESWHRFKFEREKKNFCLPRDSCKRKAGQQFVFCRQIQIINVNYKVTQSARIWLFGTLLQQPKLQSRFKSQKSYSRPAQLPLASLKLLILAHSNSNNKLALIEHKYTYKTLMKKWNYLCPTNYGPRSLFLGGGVYKDLGCKAAGFTSAVFF